MFIFTPMALQCDKYRLLGQFDPALDEQFVELPQTRCDGSTIFLHQQAADAFEQMAAKAGADGIRMIAVSGFRSFERQQQIWNNKWTGTTLTQGMNLAETVAEPIERAKLILLYSAMPGTSRHHWGTDLDINSVEPAYFATPEGEQLFAWLQEHAAGFGFARPYTAKGLERPDGYEEEKWHWSYLPLSKPMLTVYNKSVSYLDLKGFLGAETALKLGVIENYVNGIHPACIQGEV